MRPTSTRSGGASTTPGTTCANSRTSSSPSPLAPKLVSRFQAALIRSGAGSSESTAARALGNALLAWRAASAPERGAKWTERHWADLGGFVAAWTGGESVDVPAFREVGDGTATLGRLAEIETSTRPRALELRREIDLLNVRAKRLEEELVRADNATGGLLLEELRTADERVGATEATLVTRQGELKTVRGQLVTADRERERLREEQAEGVGASDRAALAVRTAQALAVYEARLLEHKLGQLEEEFVRRFNLLVRKGDLISGVRIDRVTFAATLIDRAGREVPKAALSAGEKQIYAIAMLWALARTSGRPLPMIIDTPLARLDSEHRDNLIRRYFPNASHQVILLSTDTEVDDRLMSALGRNVSHAYRLDYDPELGRTVATEGYFGTKEDRRAPRALQQA